MYLLARYPLLTLSYITAGAIFQQYVIKCLVGSLRQAVYIHVVNPVWWHHAKRIPAKNDSAIIIPNQSEGGKKCSSNAVNILIE
ncbi:hypothetical protein XELAEV_18001874mg [Xenopus laevis]|uniref:Uncharacterized protein n=1 Tax=Xenopus laevis TaxID=8355 RepID=A0A974GYQ1_XENLA|nr:hypothetical protein XELAEV_18001874mg [Xenopus laevis]